MSNGKQEKVEQDTGKIEHENPVLSDDQLLLNKLKYAETTNENVLFEEDIQHAKELLPDLYSHYSIALAPHKRLPLEIVLEIFLDCISDSASSLVFSVANRLPLILGQVCARWRQISRNERRLWKKTVINLRDDAASLAPACACLPPSFDLSVESPLPGANYKDILVPHLWRVQKLSFIVSPEMMQNFWRSTADTDCLSTIKSLSITHLEPESNAFSMRVIPWAALTPLQHARSLRELKLSGMDFPLSSLHIPWSQLHSLTISLNIKLDDVPHILESCTSLEELHLEWPFKFYPAIINSPLQHAISPFDASAGSHVLQKLFLTGNVQTSALQFHAFNFANLVHLDIYKLVIDGNVQYKILQRCTNLETLRMKLEKSSLVPLAGNLLLSRLCKLVVDDVIDDWLFVALHVPSLVELEVYTYGHSPSTLLSVQSMLKSSGCSLLYLTLWLLDKQDSTYLTTILSMTPDAIKVTVPRTIMDKRCIEELATGTILPCLKKLECKALSDEAFIDMVEKRAYLASHNKHVSMINDAHCGPLYLFLKKEDRLERMKRLQDSYGIKCVLSENS